MKKYTDQGKVDTRSGFGALAAAVLLFSLIVVMSCHKSNAEQEIVWTIQCLLNGKEYNKIIYKDNNIFHYGGSRCVIFNSGPKARWYFYIENEGSVRKIPFYFWGSIVSDTTFFVEGKRYSTLGDCYFDDRRNGYYAWHHIEKLSWFEFYTSDDPEIVLYIDFELAFSQGANGDTLRMLNGRLTKYNCDTSSRFNFFVPDSLFVKTEN